MGLVRLGTAYVAFSQKPFYGSLVLECVHGRFQGRIWATRKNLQVFVVGRKGECDLRIPNEMQSISSRHLHFECEPDVGWTVMDTSTFGTTLYNNWPLKKE